MEREDETMILDQMSGQMVYASIPGLRPVSLCFFILPPGDSPIILDQVFGRIPYASIVSFRAWCGGCCPQRPGHL